MNKLLLVTLLNCAPRVDAGPTYVKLEQCHDEAVGGFSYRPVCTILLSTKPGNKTHASGVNNKRKGIR